MYLMIVSLLFFVVAACRESAATARRRALDINTLLPEYYLQLTCSLHFLLEYERLYGSQSGDPTFSFPRS